MARFTYDSIVDRDLIVVAEDLESLPEAPKHSRKSQEERAADIIQKMGNLLGKSEPTSPGSLPAAHCNTMLGHVCRRMGSQFAADIDEILCVPAKRPWAKQLHQPARVCAPQCVVYLGHRQGPSPWRSGLRRNVHDFCCRPADAAICNARSAH